MRTLTICGNPIARYTIVLNPVPAPAETTAAEFLQRVIAISCGVTLPMASEAEYGICIGTREACPRVQLDGFRITTDERSLYLDGNIPRGTLYAAFDFAENYLGYRRFAIDCEVIPTEGAAEVPENIDRIDNPGMEARHARCHTQYTSPTFSAHCRLNDNMNIGEELGGCTEKTAGGHSFGDLMEQGRYFAEHPEYYSLVNGERIPCYGGHGPGQLCLTNPDVIRIVTENVLRDLREHPEKTVVDVSQNDNDNYCTCEHCAAVDEEEGSHCGSIIRFVNAVAEAVEKEFPHVMVQTFAYAYGTTPPKKTRARDNVIIRYCPMAACFRHGINDTSCPSNARFREEISGWANMCSHMSLFDYLADWNCYIAPYPNLISIYENIRFFAECNVRYVCGDCNGRDLSGGVYPDLKAYMYAKMLWNPRMSVEEYRRHIAEFLQGFYGPGWREIGRYLALEYEATKDRCVFGVEDIDICFLHYTSDPPVKMLKRYLRNNFEPEPFMPMVPNHPLVGIVDRMTEAQDCFDRALAMAETETDRFHIRRSRMAIDYLDLFCSDNDEFAMSAEEKQRYLVRVEKFKEDKVKYGFYWNLHTELARKR